MQFTKFALLAVALFARPASGAILSKPVNSSVAAAKAPTAADVAKLHKKLEGVAQGLQTMLSASAEGSLSHSQIAPDLRGFLSELRSTLSATASEKNATAAMIKLHNAQAGVVGLTKELNAQQEFLMKQDDAEETNLLLGVLMTRRGEPIKKQLEVLESADFKHLPVSKALLAHHDDKTPLFQQAAEFADKHEMSPNMTAADQKAQHLQKTLAYFEHRVAILKNQEETMERLHKKRDHEIEDLINSTKAKNAHHLELMKKSSDREYKKRLLAHKQETKMMEDVVVALKKGDVVALKRAQNALQAHMKAMQAKTGNFLHFLQLGHRLASHDCPFCVAQCIGKCHDGGNPYAQCMVQCADAGH